MNHKILYLDSAISDLAGIDAYHALFSEDKAIRTLNEILDAVEVLEIFPRIGVARGAYRRLVRGRYAIYYRVDADRRTVEIVRVLDCRQALNAVYDEGFAL